MANVEQNRRKREKKDKCEWTRNVRSAAFKRKEIAKEQKRAGKTAFHEDDLAKATGPGEERNRRSAKENSGTNKRTASKAKGRNRNRSRDREWRRERLTITISVKLAPLSVSIKDFSKKYSHEYDQDRQLEKICLLVHKDRSHKPKRRRHSVKQIGNFFLG